MNRRAAASIVVAAVTVATAVVWSPAAVVAAGAQPADTAVTIGLASESCTPPPAPNNLRPLDLRPTSVTIRWTIVVSHPACDPTSFDVLRAPGAGGGTFTPLAHTGLIDTFADTTVAPNTTYRYQVQARAANGLVSAPSNTLQVTTPSACTPQLPMGNLTVTAVTASSVSLSWVGPTNPACFAYDILRTSGTSTSYTMVGSTTGLSFTDTGLASGTTYRYVVRGRIIPTGNPWGATNVAGATTHYVAVLSVHVRLSTTMP